MKNTHINVKKTILKMLSKLDDSDVDYSRSVTEMKHDFEKQINEYEVESINKEKSLISEFSNVYLKSITQNKLFGKQLDVMHITELEFEAYSTDNDKVYRCKGEIIHFSKMNITMSEIMPYHSGFTESKLRSCEVISKERYEAYKKSYENFETNLKEIMI